MNQPKQPIPVEELMRRLRERLGIPSMPVPPPDAPTPPQDPRDPDSGKESEP